MKNNTTPILPPVAKKIDHSYTVALNNGETREISDPYNWLRDPKWPDAVDNEKVIEHLKAENAYNKQYFDPLKDQTDAIFKELKGRVKLSDQSVPVKKDENYYYSRTEEDKQYPIYCRKLGSKDAPEEIYLDVNEIAKGQAFTNVQSVVTSPNQELLAYAVDFTGDEKFSIKVYNLKTKEYLPDEIAGVSSAIIWHEQLNGFFYTPQNESLRKDTIKFHFLGNPLSDDKEIFHIEDPIYQLYISKSSSKQYIFINVSGHGANEVHTIKMDDNSFETKLIRPLEDKIFYYPDHHHSGKFYILTNYQAKNFQIISVDDRDFQSDLWNNNYIAEDQGKYLSCFDITKNYLILNYSDLGIPLIKIKNLQDGSEKTINFPDPSFTAESFSTNYEDDDIRVEYSSLARPKTTYNYDYNNEGLEVLKTEEIPSGFNPEEYTVKRIFADNEGVKIPITLLYKNQLIYDDNSNNVYLYGYGSYGVTTNVSFSNKAISLVNHGFIYAIAHIRGSNDLGHDWYEQAKFLTKTRTFDDFIACSKELISQNYTTEGKIIICGGSAGGLLIGAVINKVPALYKAAISHVAFVDVLNTMLDEKLPLTPGEFKEWGNPKDLEYFDYIKSYSPYENVKAQKYPNLYATAKLSDTRVGYYELAKWVAKIRDLQTGDNTVLLNTDMKSGHQGASGRFDYLKDVVTPDIVFALSQFDIKVTGDFASEDGSV